MDTCGKIGTHGIIRRIDIGASVVIQVNSIRIIHRTAKTTVGDGLLGHKHIALGTGILVEAKGFIRAIADPNNTLGRKAAAKQQKQEG
jgi:hypothetical protein